MPLHAKHTQVSLLGVCLAAQTVRHKCFLHSDGSLLSRDFFVVCFIRLQRLRGKGECLLKPLLGLSEVACYDVCARGIVYELVHMLLRAGTRLLLRLHEAQRVGRESRHHVRSSGVRTDLFIFRSTRVLRQHAPVRLGSLRVRTHLVVHLCDEVEHPRALVATAALIAAAAGECECRLEELQRVAKLALLVQTEPAWEHDRGAEGIGVPVKQRQCLVGARKLHQARALAAQADR
mmetsp:Transcript_10399/g.26183  ORF Transcript_10399/g.26183 Transcript_10399/m.26183 type:complete len:234 (-) Transcript_10399:102-803(-)